MLIQRIKQIFMICMMYAAFIGIWSITASFIEGYPSPTSTLHVAFGGVDAQGEEVESVLAHAFVIEEDEEQGIFWHFIASITYVFGGFALVLFVGLPLGLMVGLSKTFEYGFDVVSNALKVISPVVWLPFILMLFQDPTMVALFTVFIAALWPVVSSTAQGVVSVHKDYLKMSTVLQLSPLEKLIDVILPLVVPYIFEGMRRSLWIAWITIIPVEMLLEDKGLGYWIWNAYNEELYEHVLIGIFIVYIVGLAVGYLMKKIANYFDYMH